MSIHNRYAHVPLTDEDFTSFDTQFAIIQEIMAVLPEVDGRILRRVAKLGFKSDTFTRDTLMLAAQHEELLPRGLDVDELESQVRLRDELRSRAKQMKRMAREMELVVQLLGSDVFSGALAAYKAMKTNHRGTLVEELRELGRLFRRKKKGGDEAEGPETRDQGLSRVAERPETRDQGRRQPVEVKRSVPGDQTPPAGDHANSPSGGDSTRIARPTGVKAASVVAGGPDSPGVSHHGDATAQSSAERQDPASTIQRAPLERVMPD